LSGPGHPQGLDDSGGITSGGVTSKIVSIGVLVLVLIFWAASVTVIICAVQSYPLPNTAVHVTSPIDDTRTGVQSNHGIVTVTHSCNHASKSVIVEPLSAGLGVINPTIGSVGGLKVFT